LPEIFNSGSKINNARVLYVYKRAQDIDFLINPKERF
jgi:hypothetical protein